MIKKYADLKAAKKKTKQKRTEVDHQAAESSSYYSRESEEAFAPDDEVQIEAVIQTSLDDKYR